MRLPTASARVRSMRLGAGPSSSQQPACCFHAHAASSYSPQQQYAPPPPPSQRSSSDATTAADSDSDPSSMAFGGGASSRGGPSAEHAHIIMYPQAASQASHASSSSSPSSSSPSAISGSAGKGAIPGYGKRKRAHNLPDQSRTTTRERDDEIVRGYEHTYAPSSRSPKPLPHHTYFSTPSTSFNAASPTGGQVRAASAGASLRPKKTALIFPGQGSQYVAMCRDIYRSFRSARSVWHTAEEALITPTNPINPSSFDEHLNNDGGSTRLHSSLGYLPGSSGTDRAVSELQRRTFEEELAKSYQWDDKRQRRGRRGWLRDAVFFGDQLDLTRAENAQPSILVATLSILAVLRKEFSIDLIKNKVQFAAGHGSGTYAALVGSGALDIVDAVRLLRHRGLISSHHVYNHPTLFPPGCRRPDSIYETWAFANAGSGKGAELLLDEHLALNAGGVPPTSGASDGEVAARESLSQDLDRSPSRRGWKRTQMSGVMVRPGMLSSVLDEVRLVQSEIRAGLIPGVAPDEVVEASNINSSLQIVLSGTRVGVSIACDRLRMKNMGARAVNLPVSGPYHSSLMSGAVLGPALANLPLRDPDPALKLVSSVDGSLLNTAEDVRADLTGALAKPVRWLDAVNQLRRQGVERFVCLGPGRACAHLLSKELGYRDRIERAKGEKGEKKEYEVWSVATVEDIETLSNLLSRVELATLETPLSSSSSSSLEAGSPALGGVRAYHTGVGVGAGRSAASTSTSARASPLLGRRPIHSVSSPRPALRRAFSSSPASTSTSTSSADAAAAAPASPGHADAVILGGGVVGLALACGLVASRQLGGSLGVTGVPLRVVLLEAGDLGRLRGWAAAKAKAKARSGAAVRAEGQDQGTAQGGNAGVPAPAVDWENRVVSLTEENWAWLDEMGVTPFLSPDRIQPITAMHVTDGLSGAALDLGSSGSASASGSGSAAPLSRMVELSNLQQGMLRFIEERSDAPGAGVRVEVWDRTRVEGIDPDAPAAADAQAHVDAWPVLSLSRAAHPSSPAPSSGTSSAAPPPPPPHTRLRPRLLVGADGGNSPVRKYAGIDKYGWSYGRAGLVGTLRFDARESAARGANVAYQRFLPTGTLAWLPLDKGSASMVWTLPPDLAKTLGTLFRADPATPDSFLPELVSAAWRLPYARLAACFDFARGCGPARAGELKPFVERQLRLASDEGSLLPESEVPAPVRSIDAGSVASFPLSVAHADAYLGSSLLATQAPPAGPLPGPAQILDKALNLAGLGGRSPAAVRGDAGDTAVGVGVGTPRGRTVLIGDAAHSIHPLAGQGLNLGLLDARALARALETASKHGADSGSHEALRPYEAERYAHNQVVLSAVDHLHWLFAGVPVPRGLDFPSVSPSAARAGESGARLNEGEEEEPGRNVLREALREGVGRSVLWARSTGMEVLNEMEWVKERVQEGAGSRGGRR